MRQTMRPVTLGRIIEVCYLAENSPSITEAALIEKLSVSKRRSREILLETERMHLLKDDEEHFVLSEFGNLLLHSIRNGDWNGIHQIMMNYPYYEVFYNAVNDIGPAEKAELLKYLTESDIKMNQTTIDVMADWTERIGFVQRNVFSGRYYVIKNQQSPFIPCLLANYNKLNRNAGIALRQRYVEIPNLREAVCEELLLSRNEFDREFIEIYKKNIGLLELSGAPVTTHAKQSKKKIKSLIFEEMPDWITMNLTSDQFLNGIEYGSKKYYYLAVHGELLK